jgi:hypothetical protein
VRTFKFPNGSIYKGTLRNGLPHGWGQVVHAEDDSVYTGHWEQGVKVGFGEIKFEDGTRHIGEFRANPEGYGIHWSHDGNIFLGQFRQGVNILGKMILPNGNTYDGVFVNS